MERQKILKTSQEEIQKVKKEQHGKYQYTKYQVTDRSEFQQMYAAIYEIPPKSYNYPYHYHIANTELFYIIQGEGILETEEGEIPLKAGDVIVIPPGEKGAHRIYNPSDKMLFRYLDVDTVNSPEIVKYPHSQKTGILVHNQSADFYKEEERVSYYEGE